MKTTLIASTPHGEFNRKTDSDYRFITVWASPRAKAVFDNTKGNESGVYQRWVKDRGYAVTWHGKRPSPKKYDWDQKAVLLGIYEVGGC